MSYLPPFNKHVSFQSFACIKWFATVKHLPRLYFWSSWVTSAPALNKCPMHHQHNRDRCRSEPKDKHFSPIISLHSPCDWGSQGFCHLWRILMYYIERCRPPRQSGTCPQSNKNIFCPTLPYSYLLMVREFHNVLLKGTDDTYAQNLYWCLETHIFIHRCHFDP